MPSSSKITAPFQKNPREPCVGIFWLVNGRLVLYSTPVSEAEPYGRALNHPEGHPKTWEQVLRSGAAPPGSEYDEFPRGRIVKVEGRFILLADKCILKDGAIIREIRARLNLPSNLNVDTDSHYRCPACLYPEPDDWDND